MSSNVLKSTTLLLEKNPKTTPVSYNEKRGALKVGKKHFKVFDLAIKGSHYMLIVPKIKNVRMVPDVNLRSQMKQLVLVTKFKSANKTGKDLLKQVGVSVNCIRQNPGSSQKVVKKGKAKVRAINAILAKCHSSQMTVPRAGKNQSQSRRSLFSKNSIKHQVKRSVTSSKSKKPVKNSIKRTVKCGYKKTVKSSNKKSVKRSIKTKTVKRSVSKTIKCGHKKSVKCGQKKSVKRNPVRAIKKQAVNSSSRLARKLSQSKNAKPIQPVDYARVKKATKTALKKGSIILRSGRSLRK